MKIKTDRAVYELLPDLGILVNAEIAGDFAHLRADKVDDGQIIKTLRNRIRDNDIKTNLSSVRAIALGVTEECNFRCRYCVFSGDYLYTRTHTGRRMDVNTAIAAVDFFLDLIKSDERTRKLNTFSIGFYGGEPLLEFDLIKETIAHAERVAKYLQLTDKFKIDFRITTNGYLLKGKIIDFLKEKDVHIDISLDGPKEEHDKFRRLRDGHSTWAPIMENIAGIVAKYPVYYKEKVNYLSTLHPGHDHDRIERFFKGDKRLFDFDSIRFNKLDTDTLKPVIKDRVLKDDFQNMSNLFLGNAVKNMLKGRFRLKHIELQSQFTGACFPGGEKVFINAGGRFHICEKMSPHFPIGDVTTGFDIERIRHILTAFNEEVIRKKCWQCDVWFLCGLCFVHAAREKKIAIDCEEMREGYLDLVLRYLIKLEEENDKTPHGNYRDIIDFIEQL